MAVKQLFCRLLLPGFVQNNTQHSGVVPLQLFFFSRHFVILQLLQTNSSTHTVTAWMNSHFILSERLDFHTIDNLSIALNGFLIYIDIAFSR